MENFYSETYLNSTNDILDVNSDVAYTNVERLDIYTGEQEIVVNVRGTSAETFIETQDSDDRIFVSSDADLDVTNAESVDVLFGILDYVEEDLHFECNGGVHRLMISDVFSTIPKGVGTEGPAELTESSLLNLADNLGNIEFVASSGNFYEGVTLWLGTEGDHLNVTSIQSLGPYRTTTSVHAGNGSDVLSINLENSNHSLFVANGQGDDDVLDATHSSLPVILFGDGGNDELYGGSNADVLIGDYGLVFWKDDSGAEIARAGECPIGLLPMD